MNRLKLALLLLTFMMTAPTFGQNDELIATNDGDLELYKVGHASLIFKYQGKVIHVDPWSKLADYNTLPKADLIVITHHHMDHLDNQAISSIKKDNTSMIWSAICDTMVEFSGKKTVLANGQSTAFEGIKIEAVPAYNLVHKRENGEFFHPKGDGNGYIFTFGDKRIYVAGDTEDIPEMAQLGEIEVAFLPMNLPYTMTPEMTAHAASMVRPKILYPYHYGDTNTQLLVDLLKAEKEIEIRIR